MFKIIFTIFTNGKIFFLTITVIQPIFELLTGFFRVSMDMFRNCLMRCVTAWKASQSST